MSKQWVKGEGHDSGSRSLRSDQHRNEAEQGIPSVLLIHPGLFTPRRQWLDYLTLSWKFRLKTIQTLSFVSKFMNKEGAGCAMQDLQIDETSLVTVGALEV